MFHLSAGNTITKVFKLFTGFKSFFFFYRKLKLLLSVYVLRTCKEDKEDDK